MTVISVVSIAFKFAMRQASRKIAWRSSAIHSPRFHRCLLLVPNSTNERPHARSIRNSACIISNPKAYRSGCCRSLTTSGGPRFPPVAEAASVLFPGRDMRVSRVGFGSPWIGAASDRGLELSRALSDGGCNLVQLTSEVKTVRKHDDAGKPLPVPEWPARSWETRTFENIEIPRNDLCLLWELPVSSKPVKEALSPTRGMEHLDRLLTYQGLSYIDVFLFEIPPFEGGEDAVNEYRRHTGEAIRSALTEFTRLAGDRIKALGFSWKVNPHIPYPGRAPDSPLSDVMELRDLLAPSKPLVAMLPAGVACGVTVDDLEVSNGGIMGLPESSGVFQIGTNVTHARRPDGRPFRLVDVYPRPIEDIMPDLKSMLGMTIHMEREYSKRFVEDDGQEGLKGEDGQKDGDVSPSRSPLPPKNDVSWGHILAHNQHQLPGLDEWEMIRDCQIKPTVNRALDTLRIRGEAEGEWGFLYRSTLGSLMSELSAAKEVRKAHQLAEVSKFMDVFPPKGRDGGLEGCDTGGSRSGETLVSRCVAVALSTGVDCVLDEEYSASREAGRMAGLSEVPPAEVKKLYKEFRLPE